jgi:hypothetical protein
METPDEYHPGVFIYAAVLGNAPAVRIEKNRTVENSQQGFYGMIVQVYAYNT